MGRTRIAMLALVSSAALFTLASNNVCADDQWSLPKPEGLPVLKTDCLRFFEPADEYADTASVGLLNRGVYTVPDVKGTLLCGQDAVPIFHNIRANKLIRDLKEASASVYEAKDIDGLSKVIQDHVQADQRDNLAALDGLKRVIERLEQRGPCQRL
jgi:hypothetical protein